MHRYVQPTVKCSAIFKQSKIEETHDDPLSILAMQPMNVRRGYKKNEDRKSDK